MKLKRCAGCILIFLFFYTTIGTATQLHLNNENNAKIYIIILDLNQATSIKIKDQFRKEYNYTLFPNEKIELNLNSGNYTIEPTNKYTVLQPDVIDLNTNDFISVKDGLVYCSKPIILKIEPTYAKINGKIIASMTTIAIACKMGVRKKSTDEWGHVIWGFSKELKIENGRINGELDQEGIYRAENLWLKAPNGDLWLADVDIQPNEFYISKNNNNFLTLSVTSKSNLSSVELPTNTYLIRKPTSHSQSIEGLIYKPTEVMDILNKGFVRVPLGEYLAEEINGNTIYRKKIIVGPFCGTGPYRGRGIQINFNDSDKAEFSLVNTAGTSSSTQIFQQNVDLPHLGDSFKENIIPITIGENSYIVKIQTRSQWDALGVKVFINNESFDILNLHGLKNIKSYKEIENMFLTQAPNSTYRALGGFDYSLKVSNTISQFKIDVDAYLDFQYDIGRNLFDLGGAKISCKLYQTGTKVDLLDFFK